jgi:hypothetical protein
MRGAIQQTFRQYSMDIQSGGDEFSVRPDDQYGSPTSTQNLFICVFILSLSFIWIKN